MHKASDDGAPEPPHQKHPTRTIPPEPTHQNLPTKSTPPEPPHQKLPTRTTPTRTTPQSCQHPKDQLGNRKHLKIISFTERMKWWKWGSSMNRYREGIQKSRFSNQFSCLKVFDLSWNLRLVLKMATAGQTPNRMYCGNIIAIQLYSQITWLNWINFYDKLSWIKAGAVCSPFADRHSFTHQPSSPRTNPYPALSAHPSGLRFVSWNVTICLKNSPTSLNPFSRNSLMSLSKTSNLEKGLNIVVFFCSSLRVLQITLDSLYTTLEALCLSIASLRGPVTSGGDPDVQTWFLFSHWTMSWRTSLYFRSRYSR